MKVYVQSYENGVPHNYNFANAMSGFREMGFEIVPFHTPEQLDKSDPQDVVVGYVGTVRYKLAQLGIPVEELDYPEELQEFLGRKVWSSTMNTIAHSPDLWPVFVKSQEDKQFTGNVIRKVKDLIGGGTENADSPVWCSELVEFVAEYRCFIRYGQILDVRRYKGDWSVAPDRQIVEKMVDEYTSAPAGYTIDVGVTSDGRTLLIEVNDGYALGCYGLFDVDYAKLLSARWSELTGTEDECDFDRVYRL